MWRCSKLYRRLFTGPRGRLGVRAMSQIYPPSGLQTALNTPILPTAVTTANATHCAQPHGESVVLIGVVNLAAVAQTVTVTLYDNPSAASGTIVATIAGLGASQILTFPGAGRHLLTGLYAHADGVPVSPGIEIYAL